MFLTGYIMTLNLLLSVVKLLGLEKEGNVLFNDALNTFLFMDTCHWTYGKGPFR